MSHARKGKSLAEFNGKNFQILQKLRNLLILLSKSGFFAAAFL